MNFSSEAENIFSKAHRFSHEAMATIFEIFILDENQNYAKQAAQAAFDELDRLELELSRFIENSNISKINSLKKNQSTKVGLSTFECLQQCSQIWQETNGAFDITIGSHMKCWLNKDKTTRTPSKEELDFAHERTGMNLLKLNETDFTVNVLESDLEIDLGGFGKGYALDQMAKLLKEWEIKTALLHGGKSTALALDPPLNQNGWPVTISNPTDPKQIFTTFELSNQTLSGSGFQKGQHILDPRNGKPIQNVKAAWCLTPSAGKADALSTAFMIMPLEDVKNYWKKNLSIKIVILDNENKVHRIGFEDEGN